MLPEIEEINRKIKKWKKRLEEAQNNCPHTNKTKEHWADTGNWCPSDDRYWTDFTCHDCGKRWRVDGSK